RRRHFGFGAGRGERACQQGYYQLNASHDVSPVTCFWFFLKRRKVGRVGQQRAGLEEDRLRAELDGVGRRVPERHGGRVDRQELRAAVGGDHAERRTLD